MTTTTTTTTAHDAGKLSAATVKRVTKAAQAARGGQPVSAHDVRDAVTVLRKLTSAGVALAVAGQTASVTSVAMSPSGKASRRDRYSATVAPWSVAYAATQASASANARLGGVAMHVSHDHAVTVAAGIVASGVNGGDAVRAGSVVVAPCALVPTAHAGVAAQALAVRYAAWLQAAGVVADHARHPVTDAAAAV